MIKNSFPNIYLIADLKKEREKFFFKTLESLLDSGIELFQLRAKDYNDDTLPFFIEKIKKLQLKYKAKFIINDYWYFVKEFEIDGVHLGKHDFPPEVARYIIPDKIIGYTINNIKDLNREILEKIDYIGVGPAFPTKTKKNLSPILSPEGIKEIIDKSGIPYFTIGGINGENIIKLLEKGLRYFAVSSYLMNAKDPIKAFNLLNTQILKFVR